MSAAQSPPRSPGGRFSVADRRALAVLLVLQLALALLGALNKSLVQDEFHTLFHASAADLDTLVAQLRSDNHPPAGFLVVRAARALFGDGALALRLPQILFGLLGTWLIARTCARCGAPVWLGAALWALSSTQLEFSTQVRMYALSALCSAGAIDALGRLHLAEGPARRRAAGVALALWVALGMHTHYYWGLYSAGLAVSLIACALVSRELRTLLVRALPWGVLALILIAPWYLSSFASQFGSGLPPGMARSSLTDLLEAYVHLLEWNVRLGGPLLRVLFLGAGVLGVVLGVLGVLTAWRAQRRSLALVCGALAFGVPLLASALSWVLPRIGFNWSYVLPSAPPLVILIAFSVRSARVVRPLAVLVVALGLLLSGLNALSVGTEDNRGAVRWVHEQWRPGDAVFCVELQGLVFAQGLAWDYYAPRIASESAPPHPERLPVGRNWDVEDPESVRGYPRVFLMGKSAVSTPLLARLREHYPRESVRNFGFGIDVYVLEPATQDDDGR